MQDFQDAFKTPKQSFISVFSIYMTVPFSKLKVLDIQHF